MGRLPPPQAPSHQPRLQPLLPIWESDLNAAGVHQGHRARGEGQHPDTLATREDSLRPTNQREASSHNAVE